MTVFPEFKRVQGPASACRPADPDAIAAYTGRLPEPVLDEWRESGWCAYAGGLLWFVNPAELEDLLGDWLEEPALFVPFARTAFADLCLWGPEGVHYLDVQSGDLTDLIDDVELFVESSLREGRFLKKVVNQPLYRKAESRLGPPAHDECYAFEPAVALGGPGTADTLQRVKLREHLGLSLIHI